MNWNHDNDFLAKLRVDVPMLIKGNVYYFEYESGHVYRQNPINQNDFIGPLLSGLAGYLWLLSTNGNWMRKVKQ